MRLTALLVLLPSIASGASFRGKVVGVADGDTITVLRNGKPVKIRPHGVDCPEMNQPFGKRAKQLTSKLVFGKRVAVDVVTRDRYGRTVAKVRYVTRTHYTLADPARRHRVVKKLRSLQEALVREGLAWWYRKYAPKNVKLARLEAQAKKAKRGLWKDANPVAPWDWRRGKRAPHGPMGVGNLPQQPNQPWTGDRVCGRNGDCVIAWDPCGYRRLPCTDTWRRAINRAADRRYRQHWANKVPACDAKSLCRPGRRGRWLGTKAGCVKGLCVVEGRPAGTAGAATPIHGNRGSKVFHQRTRWTPSARASTPSGSSACIAAR